MATTLLTLALAVTAIAFPSANPSAKKRGSAPAGHEYIAPGPDDVRSPCPGLNSLANHGFLPRSGKGMTIPILVAGGKAGMNMGADFMSVIGEAGTLSNPNPLAGYFDLDNLDEHDFPIEHDASLSRQDHFFGDWYDLNKKAYNQWIGQFGNAKTTTIESAAKAKYTRVQDSLKRDPEVVYGPREFILSYGETSLYLQTMGMSTTSGVARLDFIREFFVNETLPYNLGWSPGPDEVTLETLGAMIIELFLSSHDTLPEGLEVITTGVVADAFAGKDPVTGKLVNATRAITGSV